MARGGEGEDNRCIVAAAATYKSNSQDIGMSLRAKAEGGNVKAGTFSLQIAPLSWMLQERKSLVRISDLTREEVRLEESTEL